MVKGRLPLEGSRVHTLACRVADEKFDSYNCKIYLVSRRLACNCEFFSL